MARLMKVVYHLLEVKLIRTSLYHCQTDRLVEQFNPTLKSMLRRKGEKRERTGGIIYCPTCTFLLRGPTGEHWILSL